MVKLIIGKKGTGKTKQLIECVNEAVQTDKGHISFVNNGKRHIFDLDSKVRMVDTSEFGIDSYSALYGLVCGMLAQDYDISNIFIDSLTKIITAETLDGSEKFLSGLDMLSQKFNVSITITVSVEAEDAPGFYKKYI